LCILSSSGMIPKQTYFETYKVNKQNYYQWLDSWNTRRQIKIERKMDNSSKRRSYGLPCPWCLQGIQR
jgi:hypothetical protein